MQDLVSLATLILSLKMNVHVRIELVQQVLCIHLYLFKGSIMPHTIVSQNAQTFEVTDHGGGPGLMHFIQIMQLGFLFPPEVLNQSPRIVSWK